MDGRYVFTPVLHHDEQGSRAEEGVLRWLGSIEISLTLFHLVYLSPLRFLVRFTSSFPIPFLFLFPPSFSLQFALWPLSHSSADSLSDPAFLSLTAPAFLSDLCFVRRSLSLSQSRAAISVCLYMTVSLSL